MNSKSKILNKLRKAQEPFKDVAPIIERRHVVNLSDSSPAGLQARFIAEAEKIGVYVYVVNHAEEAFSKCLEIIAAEKMILAWDDAHIPLANFSQHMKDKGIDIAAHDDGKVRVGITGVDAALAATASLVLSSGAGKFRTTSLLPDKHIAVLPLSRLIADLETWAQSQGKGLAAFRENSNTIIISGPSKTADIAQELIKGAHGPVQVHVILLTYV